MESKKIAIILPTTLKIADYEDLKKLASFENSEKLDYGLFMATDEDDNYDREKLSSIFQKANEISLKKYPITKPPQICKMWRELAKEAYEKEYDFFFIVRWWCRNIRKLVWRSNKFFWEYIEKK